MCGITFRQHCVVVPITGFSSEFIMNAYFNLFSSVKYSVLYFLLLMMPWAVVGGGGGGGRGQRPQQQRGQVFYCDRLQGG